MQHGFALHRTFSDGAVTHLLRAGVVSLADGQRWDAEVVAFWAAELGRSFSPSQAAQLFLPLRLGGCGYQSAEWRRSAAFLGSWELCLSLVARGAGFTSAASFRDSCPFLVQAVASAVAELALPSYLFDWTLLFASSVRRRQKQLASDVHEAKHRHLLLLSSEADQVDIRSAGGPGAGHFLLAPDDASHVMSDTHFGVALRRRLRFAHAAASAVPSTPSHCQHRYPSGDLCGAELDSLGHHSGSCEVGGGVKFGHDTVVRWLAGWVERVSGRRTAMEQWVSQWDEVEQARDETGALLFDRATGQPVLKVKHARLDVAFVDREGRRCYVDVAIVNASTSSDRLRAQRAATDGAAAADGVRGKRSRYRAEKHPECPMVAFVVEALGRLSDDAQTLLRSVAPSANAAGSGTRSRVLRQATQALSVLVQGRLAEQLLSAQC
jgi:hypothetical protein